MFDATRLQNVQPTATVNVAEKSSSNSGKTRHTERSRGIPQQNVQMTPQDPSTPLRFARDDTSFREAGLLA